MLSNATETALGTTAAAPVDAEQWGRQKFAIFLAASIGLYAGLGLLLLACIGVVWRRRRRLNRRRLRAGASSAAVSSSSAAGGGNFGHTEWLLSKAGNSRGGGGGANSVGAAANGSRQLVDAVRLIRQLSGSASQSAVVFEAEFDYSPDEVRRCAAKLFWPELASSMTGYRSELSAYRRLERANAATFFPRLLGNVLYGGQRPCLVLELAMGGCLAEQLSERCYSWSDFCRLACGLCAAVSQLHSLGRAHCRLETASFVLRSPLVPVLVGLSGCWSSAGSHLRYSAPEVLAINESTPQHQVHNNHHGNQAGGGSGSGVKRSGKLHPQHLGPLNAEQLMQADSYSLGLILWEVASRCSAFYPTSESPPPYAPVFADRLNQQHPSAYSTAKVMTLSQARSALLAPNLSPSKSLTASLKLPVQNHPALPFIVETLEECWTARQQQQPNQRPTPASLHARFSSLAPNFV